MRRMFLLYLMCVATPSTAQVLSRPTDAPLVTAVNESWYVAGEPLQFAGELYYRAGSVVFFNGNTMVRTGHYNGVPLYADTTVEPFSIILVPISRGMMQPYERPRRGALAGTTGSRPPSFPVHAVPETASLPMAAAPPTGLPLPPGAISVYTPEIPPSTQVRRSRDVVGTAGIASAVPRAVAIGRRPESNDGIWIRFLGERWISAGAAIPLAPGSFTRIGSYAGLPVYGRHADTDEVIYVPSRPGVVAPYRRKD